MRRDRWELQDAKHDAHQERLLAEARGQRIANPAAWEATATKYRVSDNMTRAYRERVALGLFIQGENTDLFGRLPVLHGEDYRESERRKRRARDARKRAKGVVRHGRDG